MVSLTNTTSLSGADATTRAIAGETATIAATSTGGSALAEGNVQVLGSDASLSDWCGLSWHGRPPGRPRPCAKWPRPRAGPDWHAAVRI